MKTLTNLIPAPSMEGSGWTGGSYSTAHAMDGTRSLALTGTASTPEVTANTTEAIQLISNHIYYARVYGYQDTQTGGSVGFYWPIAEPSFQEGLPIGPSGQWNMYSARNGRTSFSDGSYQLRLDYNNSNIAGTMYFDCAMLIDLTADFGAGNEPDKGWCDDNIPYFGGTMDLDVYPTLIVQIVSAGFNPNPANMNTATLLSVQIIEETQYLTPVAFQANEIYSGEV